MNKSVTINWRQLAEPRPMPDLFIPYIGGLCSVADNGVLCSEVSDPSRRVYIWLSFQVDDKVYRGITDLERWAPVYFNDGSVHDGTYSVIEHYDEFREYGGKPSIITDTPPKTWVMAALPKKVSDVYDGLH